MSGSGISWAICKSAPRSRQITTPVPHHSFFTGRMPFLLPNQQRQSTIIIITADIFPVMIGITVKRSIFNISNSLSDYIFSKWRAVPLDGNPGLRYCGSWKCCYTTVCWLSHIALVLIDTSLFYNARQLS